MLAEPRHEPKVRQGVTTELIGVDGNAYAPFPRHEDLEDFAVLNGGLDGRPDIAFDWSTVAEYLARYDGTTSVNVAYVVGNSPLRIAAIGWDEVEADDARAWPTSGRCCARRWRRGRSGCRRGSTTRPAPTPPPRSWPSSWPRRPGSAASTTRTSATRWATGSSTRSGRRSRSGGGAARPSTSRTSTTGRRSRARPSRCSALVDDARAEGLDVTFDLYPYEWSSTRLLIMLPTWIQAGGVGPLKERLADRSVRERIRAEMQARGRLFAGRSLVGRAAPRRLHPAGAPRLGGPDAGRRHARDGTRRGRRDLRPAARRGPRG